MNEIVLEIIDTKITDKWGVYWTEMETTRDFLQNFYDANKNDLEAIKIIVKDRIVTVFGPATFDYQELIFFGSDKADMPDQIGQFGEGWKASVLNALRNFGCSVDIRIGDKRLNFYFENKRIGKTVRRVIFCKVIQDEPINGSLLILGNCPDALLQEFRFGLRSFYSEKNPLIGEMLDGNWDKTVAFYKSTDGNGYIFYRNLLRSRIDIPLVIVCKKEYAHIESKTKRDRDRNAFDENVLSTLLSYACKKVTNYQRMLDYLAKYWVTGHKFLSALAIAKGWGAVSVKFPENYYAKDSEERQEKIDQKDYDLWIETNKVKEEFEEQGFIHCVGYMARFGMKTPRSVAEDRLKSRLTAHLKTNSRPVTVPELAALHILVQVVQRFSKNLYDEFEYYKYIVGESEEIVKNLKTNRKYNDKTVFLNRSFFTYPFPDALTLLVREWEDLTQGKKLFLEFYSTMLTSFLKGNNMTSMLHKEESRWDEQIGKIIEEDQSMPERVELQLNRSKQIAKMRDLLSDGKISPIFETINQLKVINRENKDEFVLLSGEYNMWEQNHLNGIANGDDVEKRKMLRRLLALINNLDKEMSV